MKAINMNTLKKKRNMLLVFLTAALLALGITGGAIFAQEAGADDEDLGIQQLPLASAAHLGHDDVSTVPLYLFRRECCCLCHKLSPPLLMGN